MRRARQFLLVLAVLASGIPVSPAAARGPGETALTSGVEQAWVQVRSRYTDNPSRPVRTEIIPLSLQGRFSDSERALVLQAIRSWNTVLNDFVRLEVADGPVGPSGWTIVSADGPQPRPGRDFALALTQPVPKAGGVVILYVNRLGGRDLAGVTLHELGHVLGLAHEGEDGLMAAYYSPRAQSCVDRQTVMRLAAQRKLPPEQLNWCEPLPLAR